jgi:hypothetical protein
MRLDFTTATIPDLAQVRTVTLRVRVSQPAGSLTLWPRLWTPAGAPFDDGLITPTATIATVTMPSHATRGDGGPWTQADIDDLGMDLRPEGAGLRTYEAYIDVVYNEAPEATVTAPVEGATNTNDSSPAISWTYSDPESDVQERFQAKIYASTQYVIGSFNPDTTIPVWSSGEVLTADTTVEVDSILPNGTYRAYVRVADVGSGGRYGEWDFNEFTIDVDPPAVPTVTATADSDLKRVEVTADSPGSPDVEFFDFEYSDDAGSTWTAMRDATRIAATGTSATVYDYESPPNTPRVYRARAGRAVA